MGKIVRLNENDIEKLVQKIIGEDKKRPGLWANIRAKRARGEAPARKGSEAYKKAVEAGKKINAETDNMDDYESNTYMFWQNLETIHEAVGHILEMDRDEVNELLSDGHGWALDHIATSADDVEEVYHFLEGNNDEDDEYEGDMEKEYEAYNESTRNRIIHVDEFGFTELLPINEDGGRGDCANRSLNEPWLTPDGPKKRSVCVKNGSGNVVKVNFGDPNMRIKKSSPSHRKSFRARHKCSQKKDKATAGYWSCKFW